MSLLSSNLLVFELHLIRAVEKSYSFDFKECIHGKLVRWTNPGGMQMAKIQMFEYLKLSVLLFKDIDINWQL